MRTCAASRRRLSFSAQGTAWRYSLGIDVLGAVITGASARRSAGRPRNRLGPLQLSDSGFLLLIPPVGTSLCGRTSDPVRMTEGNAVPIGETPVRFNTRARAGPEFLSLRRCGMVGTADNVLLVLEAIRAVARRF